MNKLYTIGYQGRRIEELIKVLKRNNVETPVDVRRSSYSIRPEFRLLLLSAKLRENEIAYYHLGKLGTPKWLREKVKSKQLNRDRFQREYINYLIKCGETITFLWNLINGHRVCLMCLERDPNDCHRLLIAERLKRLKSNSLEVINL